MANKPDKGQFENLLLTNFKFLSDDYGFSINRKNDYDYILESNNAKIRIFIEYGRLVIDMEPVGESANQLLRQNLIPMRIGITVIFEYLNPGFHYEVEMLDKKNRIQNIPLEIEKRALLLKEYCGKLLTGDFSEWPALMKSIEDRYKRLR